MNNPVKKWESSLCFFIKKGILMLPLDIIVWAYDIILMPQDNMRYNRDVSRSYTVETTDTYTVDSRYLEVEGTL